VLDVTGLAQKYGAVLSHVRFAPDQSTLHATRIAAGEADAVVGCDMIVTAGDETLSKLKAGHSRVVVTSDIVPTADFARNPDWRMDTDALLGRLRQACGDQVVAVDGIRIATALLGDAIAANMFMLGLAWQKGMIPLSLSAIDRAIALNGVQIDFNKRCFLWGRRTAHDPAAVERHAAGNGASNVVRFVPREALADLLSRRDAELVDYQDAAYAQRYRQLVTRVAHAEAALGLGDALARSVAKYYFKLLAHKDEFEVARLFAKPEFQAELAREFEGDFVLHFHLGAWPFARLDPASGLPLKQEMGPWMLKAFRFLAGHKHWRGTWRDVFRHSPERKLARQLLDEYEADIELLLTGLSARSYEVAVKIACLPEKVRGYGHVRAAHAVVAAKEHQELRQALKAARTARAA